MSKTRRKRIYVELPPIMHQGKKFTFIVELGCRTLAIHFNNDKYDKYRPVGNLRRMGKKNTLTCKYKDEKNQTWKVNILGLRGMLWKYPEENAIYKRMDIKLLERALKKYHDEEKAIVLKKINKRKCICGHTFDRHASFHSSVIYSGCMECGCREFKEKGGK
jgi:hypothetical protein